MSNTIILKRSATASKIPLTTDLDLGEIAINTNDGKMFIKKDDGSESIVEIGAGGGATPVFSSDGTTITQDSVNSYVEDFLIGSDTLDYSTHPERMFFDKGKGAFRVGYCNTTKWDAASIGLGSFACNANTIASGDYSFATCNNSEATGYTGIAMGNGATSTGYGAIAMGENAVSLNNRTIAIGASATADGSYGTAVGYVADAEGSFSSAFGYRAKAAGDRSTSLGYYADSDGAYSIGVGYNANSRGAYSIAIGPYANSYSDYGVTIGGNSCRTYGEAGLTIGYDSYSYGYGGVSVGLSTKNLSQECITMGSGALVSQGDSKFVKFIQGCLTSDAVGFNAKGASPLVYTNGFEIGTHTLTGIVYITQINKANGDKKISKFEISFDDTSILYSNETVLVQDASMGTVDATFVISGGFLSTDFVGIAATDVRHAASFELTGIA